MTILPSSATEIANLPSMATAQALKAAKKELRGLMKAKLSKVPKASLETQSQAAFQALLDLKQYKDAERISVYLSMPSAEIQTGEIVRHALNAGKEVFVPYLHRNAQAEKLVTESDGSALPLRVMDMVKLHGISDYEGLERDAWGIPTVTEESVVGRERILGAATGVDGTWRRTVRLDLILMPGVAFEGDETEGGMIKRLGHGKGFYDYFLHRYGSISDHSTESGEDSSLALFGLALKEQFLGDGQVPHIPVGPHDSLLNGLIVGNGQIIKSATL